MARALFQSRKPLFWEQIRMGLLAGDVGLTPDGGHLTGGTAGLTGRMSVCRASVRSTPRSFGSRLPAW